MQNSQKTAQEIGVLVKSDARVIAAVQKAKEYEGKVIEAWGEIVKKRTDGASVQETRREMIPMERELLNLKDLVFKSMWKTFEENKAFYGLPEDTGFFDVFMHPCHDKELSRTIGNLVKIYEKINSYKPKFKKLARKMKDASFEYVELNGLMFVASARPGDVAFLEEERSLKMGLITELAEIERIKISIELLSAVFREIGEWLLEVLKTFPTTKITKDLASYFELLKTRSANAA